MFCINKTLVDKFKEELFAGKIDPEKLVTMSSEERRTYFSERFGNENGKNINTSFEQKLVLKNQQAGIERWVKKLTNIEPSRKQDILKRVQKMDKVLTPEMEDAFYADLVEHKLGIAVTMEEASKIVELSKEVEQKRAEMLNGGDRMEYGYARVAFGNYINEIKMRLNKESIGEKIQNIKENPVKSFWDILGMTAGTAKAMKASLDDSYIFRQGWKPMATNFGIWRENAVESVGTLIKSYKGEKVYDAVMADIISRPNYDKYVEAKLDIGKPEESFPETIQEKLPVLGKAFKASDDAFTLTAYKMRADIMDKELEIAEKNGVDLTDRQQLESLGKMVNSLTGRGSLGKAEGIGKTANVLLFSPKSIKSNIDVLTSHVFDTGMSGYAKKRAASNLVKIVMTAGAILAIAKAMDKNSVEEDPRSSDFGKIKIGDTRFDVTGGMAGLATLAVRVATSSTKSSTMGNINQLNSGDFGSQTTKDVVYNFFENKLSPTFAVLRDYLEGQTYSGEKPTIQNELANLFAPLPVTNYLEIQKNPNSANVLVATIADALGVATNTYSFETQWKTNTKEMQQFKSKVGEDKFNEANKKFNQDYNSWLKNVRGKQEFMSLSDEDKQTLNSEMKKDIKEKVFRDYGFYYRQDKSSSKKINLSAYK